MSSRKQYVPTILLLCLSPVLLPLPSAALSRAYYWLASFVYRLRFTSTALAFANEIIPTGKTNPTSSAFSPFYKFGARRAISLNTTTPPLH